MGSLLQAELVNGGRGPSFPELWKRMELDFELARTNAVPVALARIAVERLDRIPGDRRGALLAALGGLVERRLPRPEACAALRENELVVLLRGASAAEVESFARGMIQAARKLELPGESAPVRVGLSAGVAATRSGIDGYFETLFDVAGEGLDVARNAGGDNCVHSELYELVQRRIERTKGPRKPVPPPAPAPVTYVAPATANAASRANGSSASSSAPAAASVNSVPQDLAARAALARASAPAPKDSNASAPARPAPASAMKAIFDSQIHGIGAQSTAQPVSPSTAPEIAQPAAEPRAPVRSKPLDLPREEAAAVEARVRELLPPPSATPAVDLAGLESKVLEIARAAFERVIAERAQQFKSEIELYERRIAKMQAALDRADDDRSRGPREIETGVASVYRAVQGLHGNEPDFTRRSGLLAQIAESNRALFDELRRQSA